MTPSHPIDVSWISVYPTAEEAAKSITWYTEVFGSAERLARRDTDGVRPGGDPPPHVHGRDEEFFDIVQGRLPVSADGQGYEAEAGSYVGLPKGLSHGFKNPAGR